MNKRKTTLALSFLYLLPWGIQFLVANFMSVFVASQPFGTEKMVGYVISFGSVITMITQLVWAKIADRSKNKCRVLMVSLVLMGVFALLFIPKGMTVARLFVLVFLFYSCYMVHQPLIDSIAVENDDNLTMPFGKIRSFASLGYALTGFVFGFLSEGSVNSMFFYVAVLAFVSAVITLMMPVTGRAARSSTQEDVGFKNVVNKNFVLFLIYSFILFMGNTMLSAFIPVYYTDGLGGSEGFYSIMFSVSTLAEWALMFALGKVISRMSPKQVFFIIAISGALKSLSFHVITDAYVVLLIALTFNSFLFAALWASATPYLKKIIPAEHLTVAQGAWTVVSSGIAPAVGAFIGGYIAEGLGLKNLFLVIAILYTVIAVSTIKLFPATKNNG